MCAEDKLALDIADLLGVPKNIIWYEVRFAYNKAPTIQCEYEIWAGNVPKVVDGEIVQMKKKYKIHVEEINND